MTRWLFASCALPLALGCATAGLQGSSIVQSTAGQIPSGPSGGPQTAQAARITQILAEPDRAAADRALDEPRQAAEVLAYLDVTSGMNVAVLAPGSGYFLDLIARSVGLEGRIFARNPPSLLATSGLGGAWDARLAQPAGARVIRIDDELGKQLAVSWLDLVFLDHDYVTLAAPVGSVGGVAWNALRTGGRFVVVESEANEGAAREAIERDGFHFVSAGSFLRNGADPADWRDQSDRAVTSAKHVLLTFAKP